MPLSIKTLFPNSMAKTPQQVQTPQQIQIPQSQNPHNKRDGETYHRWGLRVCAINDGSVTTLKPFLQNVYLFIQQEQTNNKALQEEEHRKIQCQIEQKRNDINALNNQVNNSKTKQEEKKGRIDELNNEKKELKEKESQVNKEAKLKLIIGLIILVPLTIYLFIFYSSTFYSAFFNKNIGSGGNLFNLMLDPQALSKALSTSVTELCFVLFAPIIFLGLGFILHFFSVQHKWTKYIKMAAILCITFIFDAILAYKIGQALHQMALIIGAVPLGTPYGLKEAVGDINTWSVIFCGFIAYIIWGIVFDMVMTAHGELDMKKISIQAIDDNVKRLDTEIGKEEEKEKELNKQINNLNNEISRLTSELGKTYIIDTAAIRKEMTNFFMGWLSQMSVLGKSEAEKKEANETFEVTTNLLLKKQ